MTKLKLSLIQKAGEILSPKELKKIIGGKHYGSGTCGAYIPLVDKDENGRVPFPSFGSLPPGSKIEGVDIVVKDGATILRNISKETALDSTQNISGAKWCCDSCSEASWY